MNKFLIFINIKENDDIYDILNGGPNYLGHTFIMEENMSKEELKLKLINLLNKLNINFINISIFETQDKSQKILNFKQVKSKLKKGLIY